jgi:uncharacterized protein YjbI with pentapeptide repeats
MSWLKNNRWMPVSLVVIVVGAVGYWFYFQKNQIEPLAKQINSTKVNQNNPIAMKDYVLMKRDLITSQNTLNNSVFQFVSSSFLFLTAFIAWRNLVVSEKKQIVESFAKAVEQLGSNELHARVGGIFVLEQIAQSSPEYHWSVIEVLTSYIRDVSRKGKSTFKPFKPESEIKEHGSDNNNIEKTSEKKFEQKYQEIIEKPGISVTTDIQAALTVIGRRNSKQDPQDRIIDLRFCDIRGANIKNANLSYADLKGAKISYAQLENANLSSAKLQTADLSGAILNGANLSKSSLNDAVLKDAYLQKTDLQNSDLSNANLLGAHLQGAKLNHATLHYSNFIQAELQGANLREAKLKRTDLRNAKIDHTTELDEKWNQVYRIYMNQEKNQIFDEEADFSDAILTNIDFEGCALKRAIFSGADLEGANFKNADLEGADFRSPNGILNLLNANFSGACLKGAVFKDAGLQCADFRESTRPTDMREVVFEGVNLIQANFENVCLEEAQFTKSILHNTSFCKAKLKKALFESCYYKETSFRQADIEGTTFRPSSNRDSIEGADFSYSNKEKANFQNVDI